MARFMEPTAEQEASVKKWIAERPPEIRAMAERFDIYSLYRLKSTSQRVMLDSFNEDGTVAVIVSGRFNLVTHDRRVWGIDPNDLDSR